MKIAMCFILVIYSEYVCAQNTYKGGIKLQAHAAIPFGKDWRLGTRLGYQQLLFNGLSGKNFVGTFHNDQLAFQMILNRKISKSFNWGLGYDIHLRKGQLGNRFIQQFSFNGDIPEISIEHRFRLDEIIEKNEPVKYRMGYRIGFEKVLKKKKDGLSKMYVKLSNEYRHFIQARSYNIEINSKAYLGFICNQRRIEFGLDYGLQQLLSEYNKQALWVTIDFY